MAVKIKLMRMGKIRAPQYRIVVADARTKRDGRSIETIGKYHPLNDPSFIEVDSDRVQHWLSVGAQPTEPVAAILRVTGDWQKFKGLPGAEGTLRVAEPKPNRKALYEDAAREAQSQGEATTPKSKKKADAKPAKDDAAAPAAEAPAVEVPAVEVPATEVPAAETAATEAPAAEAPAAADAPAEASDTPAKA